MSRAGYAIAEIDHLLPQSLFHEHVIDERNFALSCRICNGAKGNVSLLRENENAKDMLTNQRAKLIERAREHIADYMKDYDKNWRRATEILEGVWWKTKP
ncbi:MAG: hypothetical protein P8011_07070 [Acidihalobacter sp.]|jgi:hypothetical protein|uniref:hypothetical protein n=1 Tax=Acidihalobacter sp. TaxID=1872108 RepID=UPI00307EE676